jgi:hypothetical protein
LGKEIDVLGLDVSLTELEAGKIVPFALYYQAHARIDRDYVAQFLLLDQRGNTVWAQERDLVSASYPTPHWQTGELLKGLHEFLVPPHVPAAQYQVAVRLVDRQGNRYKVHRPRWNVWPGSRLVLFDLDVQAREYSSDLPEISIPLQVGVGEWGELLGYDLDRDTLAGGERIEFTLYWMATQPVTKSYKVFVHLVGRDGHMGAQKDSVPASWARPTYTWAPGEPIIDTHQVPLPADIAPGQYDVLIGLYDEKSGQRVTLYPQDSEPAEQLTLSSLTVQ